MLDWLKKILFDEEVEEIQEDKYEASIEEMKRKGLYK